MLGSSPNKCRFIAWKIIDIIEGGPGLGDVRDISPAVVARQWLSRATGNNFITATSLEWWLINGIITRMADILRWVTYGEIHPEWCVFLLVQVNLTIHGGWHALLIALGRRFQILDEPLLLCSVYWVLWAPAWCHVPSFYDVYVNVIYIYICVFLCPFVILTRWAIPPGQMVVKCNANSIRFPLFPAPALHMFKSSCRSYRFLWLSFNWFLQFKWF